MTDPSPIPEGVEPDAGPLVLITNDDGIDAPGLHALAAAAGAAGYRVVVAAPLEQASGASAAIRLGAETDRIAAVPRDLPGAERAFGVDAAPAMIVLLALSERFGERPDVVLSGINHGANVGRVILHSGTVGAALTAGASGARGLAVSLDVGFTPTEFHWESAARLAVRLIAPLVASSAGTVFNLNVPNHPEVPAVVEAPLDPAGIVHTTAEDADDDAAQVRVSLGSRGRSVPGSDADLLATGVATITSVTPPTAVPLEVPLP